VEKRLVVVVAAVLFLVVNAAFVVPHFSDLNLVNIRAIKARQNLDKYRAEIQQMSFYSNNVAKLQGEGLDVPPEDQAAAFTSAILGEASRSGVTILTSSKQTTRTNQFFLELSQIVSVQSGEQQLVNFLYNLGSGASLIRVRDLALHPDPPRYQLSANVKLVASYQKKAPAKSVAPAIKAGGPPRPANANLTTVNSSAK
jgi:hypothetical protein